MLSRSRGPIGRVHSELEGKSGSVRQQGISISATGGRSAHFHYSASGLQSLHEKASASVLAGHRSAPVSLRLPASATVAEVAQRVVTRPEACRFDPIVVVDDLGAATGVVRVESLLTRLASTRLHTLGR